MRVLRLTSSTVNHLSQPPRLFQKLNDTFVAEFTNIWETAFDVTDPSFPCTLNRTAGTADGKMGLSNHFLDKYASIVGVQSLVPDKDSLNTTNAASGPGSLGEEAKTCLALNKKQQTFFLVDVRTLSLFPFLSYFSRPSLIGCYALQYYNYGLGSVFQVAADANGVTYDSSKTIAPPITSTGGGSSSASSTSTRTTNAAMSVQALSLGWSLAGAMVAVGAVVGGAIAL